MGNIKMNVRKPYYGWGINDADYVTQPQDRSKRCPIFDTWHSMVRRCYSPNSLSRQNQYEEISVDVCWKHFTSFKAWMEKQDWEGMYLDKDIAVMGNKVYSANTCIFVPGYINTFFASPGNSKKKSNLPLGVNIKHKLSYNKYVAQGTVDSVRIHLGGSHTPELAHVIWQKWKLTEIGRVLELYRKESSIDQRVVDSLLKARDNLENELVSGLITERLRW